jgi:hypothetical protein
MQKLKLENNQKGVSFLTVRAYRGAEEWQAEAKSCEKRGVVCPSYACVNQIIEKQRYSLPSVTFSWRRVRPTPEQA